MPLNPLSFLGEGSPTKIDYGEKGTLILTSQLEDLDGVDELGKPYIHFILGLYQPGPTLWPV